MAGRFPQGAMMNIDFAKGSIAFGFATGVAIYSALYTGGYKPDLAAASLLVMVILAVGAYVSSTGRRHRTLAFFNFCACFIPLIIAVAHGGEFDAELVKKIYGALP